MNNIIIKEYVKKLCNKVMSHYKPEALPPAGSFHYHQGVFLSGVQKCNKYLKISDYDLYIKEYVDLIVKQTESIFDLERGVMRKDAVDDLMPGILLFALYDKTGDEVYKRVLNEIISAFDTYKRNEEGGFWHMLDFPDQMWLDGLYMASPLLTEYAARYGKNELFDDVLLQARLMYKHCYDEKSGLLKHGWDCSMCAEWIFDETGAAPEVWGRAMGWFVVALTDILEYFPKEHCGYDELLGMLRSLIQNILRYKDENTGMWYQVVNKGEQKDNWLETSCSMLFMTSIVRSVKRGYIDGVEVISCDKSIENILKRINFDNELPEIEGVCQGTGIGDYKYYIERPTPKSDLHGFGTFLLMCAAILEVE